MKSFCSNEPVHDRELKTIMNISEINTIQQLESFLDGTQPVIFSVETNKENVGSGGKSGSKVT